MYIKKKKYPPGNLGIIGEFAREKKNVSRMHGSFI